MARSRVVVVRSAKAPTAAGGPDPAVVAKMFARGLELVEAAPLSRPDDRVGLKVNTIGGRAISTNPETALALAGWLAARGLPEKNLFVWDRTTRELRGAGYTPAAGRIGVRI